MIKFKEDIAKIAFNARLKFKKDSNVYYFKNYHNDSKGIFVTLNGLQTYYKLLKNIEKINDQFIQHDSKIQKVTPKRSRTNPSTGQRRLF